MKNIQQTNKQLWYLRRDNVMSGPFPAGLISRYILLGRVRDSDELSHDQQTWQLVSDTPEVFPEVMQADMDDPISEEHLMAAKRWADERVNTERRQQASSKTGHHRRSTDRRQHETFKTATHREDRGTKVKPDKNVKRDRLLSGLIAMSVLIALVAFVFSIKPRSKVDNVDCSTSAAAGVNWSHCRMDGAMLTDVNLMGATMKNMQLSQANLNGSELVKADLSFTVMSLTSLQGADLRGAILEGVNLHKSDLTNADLSGADLSFADLSGAKMDGAVLKNTIFHNAIWVDGRTCAAGSVGKCN